MKAKSIWIGTLGIVLGTNFGIESGICGEKGKSKKSSVNKNKESTKDKSGFQKWKDRKKAMKDMNEEDKKKINRLEKEKKDIKKQIASLKKKKQNGEELQTLNRRLEEVRDQITKMVYGPVDPNEFAKNPDWTLSEPEESSLNDYLETVEADSFESKTTESYNDTNDNESESATTESYDDTNDNGFERYISEQFDPKENSSYPVKKDENEMPEISKIRNQINNLYKKIEELLKRLSQEERRVNNFGKQSNQNAKDIVALKEVITAIKSEIAVQITNLKQTLDMQFSLLNQKISQPTNNGLSTEMLMMMMMLFRN